MKDRGPTNKCWCFPFRLNSRTNPSKLWTFCLISRPHQIQLDCFKEDVYRFVVWPWGCRLPTVGQILNVWHKQTLQGSNLFVGCSVCLLTYKLSPESSAAFCETLNSACSTLCSRPSCLWQPGADLLKHTFTHVSVGYSAAESSRDELWVCSSCSSVHPSTRQHKHREQELQELQEWERRNVRNAEPQMKSCIIQVKQEGKKDKFSFAQRQRRG